MCGPVEADAVPKVWLYSILLITYLSDFNLAAKVGQPICVDPKPSPSSDVTPTPLPAPILPAGSVYNRMCHNRRGPKMSLGSAIRTREEAQKVCPLYVCPW